MMENHYGRDKTGSFRLRKNNEQLDLGYRIISDCRLLEGCSRLELKSAVRRVVTKSWGDLGEALVAHVVDEAKWLLLVYKEEELVGVSSIHKKEISGKNIYDYELIAVMPALRGTGLMRRMNDILFRLIFFDNLIHNRQIDVEFLFTTANMKVLGSLASIAHFIYPDPYKYSSATRKIPPPDEETWAMAKEFIRQDIPPDMVINRDGCVVDGAYDETPWLIYDKEHAPRYTDRVVNEFADTYLQYDKALGKKLVVRAIITPRSIVRFYTKFLRRRVLR